MSKPAKRVALSILNTTAILAFAGAAYAAPATKAEKAAAPASAQQIPAPTLDTNGDGKPDAWDRDKNGTADAWDTNGDGKPDAVDNDGDGKPDTAPSGAAESNPAPQQ